MTIRNLETYILVEGLETMDEISKRLSINLANRKLKRDIELLNEAEVKGDMKITVSYEVSLSRDEIQELIAYKQNEIACNERQLERLG